MSGFICVEREVWNDDLFPKEPMTQREAWLWLQAQAAWADTTMNIFGETFEVPRGDFVTTIRHLQSVFGWRSDKKVRGFLDRLESAGEVGRKVVGERTQRKTQITICKYEEKQGLGRAKDAARTQDGRSTDAQKEPDNHKPSSEAKASSENGGLDRDAGFDAFWAIWPVKDGKQKARAAWRKLSLENRRTAFKAIRDGWFERWRDSNPSANAIHASTFLNQKRWEDAQQPQLRPIEGGRNGKRSVTERLFPSQPGMDFRTGGDPSQPLFPADDERDGRTRSYDRLDQGVVGIYQGADLRRM